ncbi:MAG: peptidase M15 [Muribaculaceae bacterium]|nr:peptidase M15 [Muribaculaceae bacterium]
MKYFTIEELTRSTTARLRNIDNTPSQQVIENLTALVDNVLDPLREAWGKPIRVNSGYRCQALNKAVGGVPASQHMRGEAADITAGSRDANRQLYSLLRGLNLPVDQAINEHDFQWIHVSYGPRHRRHYFAIR